MAHKITLLLEDGDVKSLLNFAKTLPASTLKTQIEVQVNLVSKNQYVRHHVYLALADLSGYDYSHIKDTQTLKADLGLGLYHKRALKNYFQKIITDLNSNNIITVKECEDLAKVSDCMTLVTSKL